MNISLTPGVEQFIQRQVASGKYATADEVILAGVRLLEEQELTAQQLEILYQGRFEELKQEIQVGLRSAKQEPLEDAEVVFERLQAKLDQRCTQAE
ncbi:MAG: type II toxin-antitoxin system ParD family antitoxin [Cyanobacteria bacterium P01_H01_bin.121]